MTPSHTFVDVSDVEAPSALWTATSRGDFLHRDPLGKGDVDHSVYLDTCLFRGNHTIIRCRRSQGQQTREPQALRSMFSETFGSMTHPPPATIISLSLQKAPIYFTSIRGKNQARATCYAQKETMLNLKVIFDKSPISPTSV